MTPHEYVALLEVLAQINARSFQNLYLLHTLTRRTTNMALVFDALVEEVAEIKTTNESAITLLQGLTAKLEAAQGDPAQLAQIIADLRVQNDALAAAVTANTPPADPGTGGGNP